MGGSLRRISSEHQIINAEKGCTAPKPAGATSHQKHYLGPELSPACSFSVAGLIIALLVNWFFSQTADVEIKPYDVSPFGLFTVQLNIVQAYTAVLFVIILLYAGIAIYSFFDLY